MESQALTHQRDIRPTGEMERFGRFGQGEDIGERLLECLYAGTASADERAINIEEDEFHDRYPLPAIRYPHLERRVADSG